MSDLFAHAGARQARAAANARFEAIWRSVEARARRRRTKLDLAHGLIDEARLCRLLGWRRAAIWWLKQAERERLQLASKGDTQSPLRGESGTAMRACQTAIPAIQGAAKGDTVSPLGGDR